LIYVCDTDNNRIVVLNIAGAVLGIRDGIKKPIAIAQDYRLNLIVCAEFDTLVGGVTSARGAVYKIDMFAALNHIETAPIARILPRPIDLQYHLDSKYTAVTSFYDNSYFIARNGPNNTSVFDPDNSILRFAPKKLFNAGAGDSLIGRVPLVDPLSTGLISANGINCMTSFSKRNFDFIATLGGESSFKAQWFHFFQSAIEEKYVSQFDPTRDPVSFVLPNRFVKPTGNCLDNSGNIFIADSDPQRDSVYKFSAYGDELQSFGGPSVFTRPVAVAVFDKTLYVLDAGQNKVLRFKLSSDF
jgi:DNA-binding beta-propeller fold protein YncE